MCRWGGSRLVSPYKCRPLAQYPCAGYSRRHRAFGMTHRAGNTPSHWNRTQPSASRRERCSKVDQDFRMCRSQNSRLVSSYKCRPLVRYPYAGYSRRDRAFGMTHRAGNRPSHWNRTRPSASRRERCSKADQGFRMCRSQNSRLVSSYKCRPLVRYPCAGRSRPDQAFGISHWAGNTLPGRCTCPAPEFRREPCSKADRGSRRCHCQSSRLATWYRRCRVERCPTAPRNMPRPTCGNCHRAGNTQWARNTIPQGKCRPDRRNTADRDPGRDRRANSIVAVRYTLCQGPRAHRLGSNSRPEMRQCTFRREDNTPQPQPDTGHLDRPCPCRQGKSTPAPAVYQVRPNTDRASPPCNCRPASNMPLLLSRSRRRRRFRSYLYPSGRWCRRPAAYPL